MSIGTSVSFGWGAEKCSGWVQEALEYMRDQGYEGLQYGRAGLKSEAMYDEFLHPLTGYGQKPIDESGTYYTGPWQRAHPCLIERQRRYTVWPSFAIMALGVGNERLGDCAMSTAAEAEGCQTQFKNGNVTCACSLKVAEMTTNFYNIAKQILDKGIIGSSDTSKSLTKCVIAGGFYPNNKLDWGMQNLPQWPSVMHAADNTYKATMDGANGYKDALVKHVRFLNTVANSDTTKLEYTMSGKFNAGFWNDGNHPNSAGHKKMYNAVKPYLDDCIAKVR